MDAEQPAEREEPRADARRAGGEEPRPGRRGAPPFSATLALLTVSRSAERALAQALEPHGLNVRKYGILGHISSDPGMSLSELARRSGITVQSTHALIGSLVAAGWVRSDVPANGRAAELTVTDAGAELLAVIAGDLDRLDAEFFASPAMRVVSDALRAALRERFGG